MSNATLDGTSITICDWRGQVVWQSAGSAMGKPGEPVWQSIGKECLEDLRMTFARVVSLREDASIELKNKRGHHFRVWLWALGAPDAAVCILSMMIPRELDSLTGREREILGLVALGRTTREISEELDVSPSTIHTHLRRVRKKLLLPSVESLTGFAARYCHPSQAPSIRIT